MTDAPTNDPEKLNHDKDRAKEEDRRLSDQTRMALAIAEIEKRLFALPINVAFGALATLCGRLIAASHKEEDKRRNNRHILVQTIDNVLRIEEARQEKERRIRMKVDQTVAEQQRAEPLKNVNIKEVELAVRSQFLADDA